MPSVSYYASAPSSSPPLFAPHTMVHTTLLHGPLFTRWMIWSCLLYSFARCFSPFSPVLFFLSFLLPASFTTPPSTPPPAHPPFLPAPSSSFIRCTVVSLSLHCSLCFTSYSFSLALFLTPKTILFFPFPVTFFHCCPIHFFCHDFVLSLFLKHSFILALIPLNQCQTTMATCL